MFYNQARLSFLRRMLQIHRNFLTTCKQKSIQEAKLQAYVTFSGRSMVEMLGVLAIIGVLSVGAMSGYSRAMMKYKLNKFSEGLNSLLNYAFQYMPQFETSGTTTSYNELMYKLNLIPDGMIYDATTQRIYDTFNNQLIVYKNIGQDGTTETNVLSVSMDTSDISKQMCQTTLTVAKEIAFALHSVAVKDDAVEGGSFSDRLWGDKFCSGSRKCLRNMTIDDTSDVCEYCDDTEKSCRLVIMWQ